MTDKIVDYSPVIDILEDILGDYKLHNDYKGQISFDCPVCSHEIKGLDDGDGKGNLEINYKEEVFKCWSCSETHSTHGTLYKLIKKYGNKKQLNKFQLLRPESNEDSPKREYKPVRLPKEFIRFKDVSAGFKMTPYFKQAWNYIKKRNITNEMIEKYDIGFCYLGEYGGRIIIPSYDENDRVNYFIARSYQDKPKLKYKNPEAQKEIIIWNEHIIKWDETIYLVEGVFDSIFLSNSIPMLGKVLHEKLFKKLYDSAKKIVIVLDGDAWDNSEKLFHKINCGKLMGKVWVVKLPINKDIADLQGDLSEYKIKQID